MKKQKIILSCIYTFIGFVLAVIIFNTINQPLVNFKKETYFATPTQANCYSFITESGDKFDITPPISDTMSGHCRENNDLDDTYVTLSLDNFLSGKNLNKFAVYPFLWESKDGRIGFLYE